MPDFIFTRMTARDSNTEEKKQNKLIKNVYKGVIQCDVAFFYMHNFFFKSRSRIYGVQKFIVWGVSRVFMLALLGWVNLCVYVILR